MSADKSECVKVIVRCRPLSNQENIDRRKDIVKIDQKRGEVQIENLRPDQGEPVRTFWFDAAYAQTCKQEEIYTETAYAIVDSVLEGYNGTIFAYGQTGTGKTFTMEGLDDDLMGVTPRAFLHIFKMINGTPGTQWLVRCCFLELYNEEIMDLLSRNTRKLEIRENPQTGVYVKDITSTVVENEKVLYAKLKEGSQHRKTSATAMNQDSSRSHSIFTVTVEQSVLIQGESHVRVGKLNLVDLAGSERQSKTHATGQRFKEAININLSLSTLGNVISALVDPKTTHVPYRDSKLTRLLQDSLGGNTKTIMIANIGPADYNFEESMNTLRYANRAKNIKNSPTINEDPKDALIRQFQEEIERLKQQLSGQFEGDIEIPGMTVIKVKDKAKTEEIEKKVEEERKRNLQQIELERRQIADQHHLAESQKKQLLQELKDKENSIKDAEEKQQKLFKKLKKMEEKMLEGQEEHQEALQKERELMKAQMEIEEKKEQERRLQEQLQQKEEEAAIRQRNYASAKEEAEDKKKRVKILMKRWQSLKSEKKDLEESYKREIQELIERNRDLQYELKRKEFILRYFVSENEIIKLQEYARYIEEEDEYMFPNLHLTGNVLRGSEVERPDAMADYRTTKQQQDELELETILDLEQRGHQNVFYVYTEDEPILEDEWKLRQQIEAQNQRSKQKRKR